MGTPWAQVPIQTLESLKWEGQGLSFWFGSWLKSVTELLGANFKQVPTVLLYEYFVQPSLTSPNFHGHAMNFNPKEYNLLYDFYLIINLMNFKSMVGFSHALKTKFVIYWKLVP